MDLLKQLQCFCFVVAASLLAVVNAGQQDRLRWLSTNFKTLLTWDPEEGEHQYNVQYAEDDGDWSFPPHCLKITETECDLTNVLRPRKTYAARVKKESADWFDDGLDIQHSGYFTPYKQSQITAVSFSLEAHEANGSVTLNITDPLTSIYSGQSLLTIRDVFKNDLMYKISYQKVGSTRKREVDRGSNMALVDDLEPHHSYCFCVAAFIPSREAAYQLGAWSQPQCSQTNNSFFQELSVEVLLGGSLVLFLLLLIIITSVFCCRRRRRRHQHTTAQRLPA